MGVTTKDLRELFAITWLHSPMSNQYSDAIGRVDAARLEINRQARNEGLLGEPYIQNHQWNTLNLDCSMGGVISTDMREVGDSSPEELIRLLRYRLYMLPGIFSTESTPPLTLIQGL